MGGPEMAPQTPQPSERPGGAVTLLYVPFAPGGAPTWPPQTPQPSERPGGAVTLLYAPFAPGGPETAPQTPRPSERSRGGPPPPQGLTGSTRRPRSWPCERAGRAGRPSSGPPAA